MASAMTATAATIAIRSVLRDRFMNFAFGGVVMRRLPFRLLVPQVLCRFRHMNAAKSKRHVGWTGAAICFRADQIGHQPMIVRPEDAIPRQGDFLTDFPGSRSR